jgi:beta-glucanase (GH16 family)
MKSNMNIWWVLISLIWLTIGCNQEDVDQKAKMPTNLELTVENLGKGSVRISVQANNANFYKVNYGLPNLTPERMTGNVVVYAYTSPGSFVITVQAHATETNFITASKTIEITPAEVGIGVPTTGYVSPLTYPGYNLVWNDEFESSSLSDNWVFEIGDGCPELCGWGNNELQYYRRENIEVKDGYLFITAKQENFGNKNYTSSRIKTQGKKSFTFGRIDVRAVLPKGQGLWPAVWMLGDNITSVGWPACGEIDIMEMVGGNADGRDNTIHGTVHWDNNGSYANYGGSKKKVSGIFKDDFHVFSIIWDESKIVWLLDNVPFHEIDTRPVGLDEFRAPHFLLFNVAVGGNWPGSPDGTTVFPQQMVVDYVRVFQKN